MPDAHLEIPAEDGAIDAYAAWPDGQGPRPPILVLSDSRGLTEGVAAVVRDLAEEGWFAVAPDLLHRAGRRQACTVTADDQREDFDAWLDYLAHERLADDTRVGVLGYGVGGALALRLGAAHGERIAAVASFYGRGPGGPQARDLASRLNAVVHLGYPADDLWLLAPAIAEFEAALCDAGVDFEAEFYPGRHGFALQGGPGYQARPARLHWRRLTELFRRTLAPRPEPWTGDVGEVHAGA